MSRRLLVLVVLALVSSGCFDGPSKASESEEMPSTGPKDATATDPDVPTDPEAVAEAPEWQIGDWWTWELEGRGFAPVSLTTVVARSTEAGYHVGVTDLSASLTAHLLHVPPVGPVTHDLGWYAHEETMRLIDFPLFDGKTWEGSLEGLDLTFTAESEARPDGPVFVVDSTYTAFDGQGPRYVYDPATAMFSEVHLHYGGDVPFSSARLVDHGGGHEGEVRLPTAQDKFLAGAGTTSAPTPDSGFAAPPEKVWLVFGCYLGGQTGTYEVTFVTPSPNEDPLRCTFTNTEMTFANDVQVLWRSSVPGDWNVLFGVGGPGYAQAEVIGVFEEVCTLGDDADDLAPCGAD